jgi:hypothetical protein
MNKQITVQEKKMRVAKDKISNLDLTIPGTIRMIYSKCGKHNCACQSDPKARHGPYYLWDRKVKGKLSSKMIPKTMVSQIKFWIQNRQKLESLVAELLSLSQESAAEQVEKNRNATGEID